MTELFVVMSIFAVLVGVVVYLLLRGANNLEPVDVATAATPTGPVVTTTAPEPQRVSVPTPKTIRVRLVSNKGRALGDAVVEQRNRRPVLRHRTKDGLMSVFILSGQSADGAWTYRRVGVERES